jgi:acylphosphatase
MRVHVHITGKVQGVGFRYYCTQQAQNLGLKGWVRNLPDGRVEGVFEGDRSQIQSILDWCHQGPSSSVVKDVTIEYEQPEGLKDFIIKR